MTRSAAILAAIQREFAEKRVTIDAATEMVKVTITVKMTPGAAWCIRSTEYSEEKIVRPRENRQV